MHKYLKGLNLGTNFGLRYLLGLLLLQNGRTALHNFDLNEIFFLPQKWNLCQKKLNDNILIVSNPSATFQLVNCFISILYFIINQLKMLYFKNSVLNRKTYDKFISNSHFTFNEFNSLILLSINQQQKRIRTNEQLLQSIHFSSSLPEEFCVISSW